MQGKQPTQARDMVKSIVDAQPERSEIMFDPYLTSSHPFVSAMADNLAFPYEHYWTRRKQKMRDAARESLKTILRVIVANLAKASFEGLEPPQIAVHLRAAKQKRTRYDRNGFNGLQKILETVTANHGGFALVKSHQKCIASALKADDSFKETMGRFTFRPEHFEQAPGRETVSLAQVTSRDYVVGTVQRELIDYADTPETKRYREEMATIDEALRKADMRVLPDGGPPVLTSLRSLRRCFNSPDGSERFDLGGRLFDGWWETLNRTRRKFIRLEGEPVAELDFASLFLRLAYLQVDQTPPDGDLYAAVGSGLSSAFWRDGVKRVVNAMLFQTTPMLRLPKDVKELLPPRASASTVRSAILAAHPAIEPVFERGLGLHLMFIESQILIAALLRLIRQGCPVALPLHDSILAPRSWAATVEQAMRDAAEEVVGFRLPIALKQNN